MSKKISNKKETKEKEKEKKKEWELNGMNLMWFDLAAHANLPNGHSHTKYYEIIFNL